MYTNSGMQAHFYNSVLISHVCLNVLGS